MSTALGRVKEQVPQCSTSTRGSRQRAVALHRAQDRAALVKNLFDLRFLYHRQLQLSLCLSSNKKSRGVEAPTEENEA